MVISTSYDDVVSGLPLDEAGFAVLKTSVSGVSLPGHGRLLALRQTTPYWLEPTVVTDVSQVPAETLLLLWERDEPAAPLGAMVALAHGKRRASLAGDKQGLRVEVEGLGDASADPVVVIGTGDEPRRLIADLMQWAKTRLGTFALRTDKPVPAWVDQLGWCTWNAFYQDVNAQRVIEGLTKLRDAGIRPRFLMLDDGWLQHNDQRLSHFEPDPVKFPDGLAPLIERCKTEFGVQQFGVWHTLQGYWRGVDPDGPLAQRYRVIQRPGNTTTTPGVPHEKDDVFGTVHADDIGSFFDDWHGYLAGQGVDMIKVDNQGGMTKFGGGEYDTGINRTELALAYHSALHQSATKHFRGQALNCMGMDNTLACAAKLGNAARNSDDYYPNRVGYQGKHVHSNAKNAIWTDNFAVADWDMFETTHRNAQLHAAARAISGGPVYIADAPGLHDAAFVQALAGDDGRVLRYNAGSAFATADRWFVDVDQQDQLMKACNTQRDNDGQVLVGVLGLFHCRWAGDKGTPVEDNQGGLVELPENQADPITDTWAPSDVDGLTGERFAAWSPMPQTLGVVQAGENIQLTLKPEAAELVQLTEIIDGTAPLGLIDRWNGGAALASRQGASCRVIHPGRFGAYAQEKPARVEVNGQDADFDYNPETSLLTTTLNGEGPFDVVLHSPNS